MAVLPPSADKHKLIGIGEAQAAAAIAALLANPSLAFLASGFLGKIVFWILSQMFMRLASMGLVMLNIGADRLITAVDKVNFDGSWEASERLIEEIRKSGRELSEEEIRRIDTEVIIQFRKFARMARRKSV